MRGKILDALFARMARDESVFFLVADMGINLIERFAAAYPQRCVNVGIAEQNLIGVSAGLCNAGFRPVAYTISNFITHRCFEQVRNDVALHNYPVVMLGASSGFDNAPLGPTHHIIDDWGTVAGIPGIDVYCPSSVPFAAGLLDRLIDAQRPAYVRIPKGSPADPASPDDIVYRESTQRSVLLVSYGSPAAACLEVARRRNDVSVLIVNRLAPLTWEDVRSPIERHADLIVVEDHLPDHGLYGILCRRTVEARTPRTIRSLAPREFNLVVGSAPEVYHGLYRLDAAGIEAAVDEFVAVTL